MCSAVQFADALLWFSVGEMRAKWAEFWQDPVPYVSTSGTWACGSASEAAGDITVGGAREKGD